MKRPHLDGDAPIFRAKLAAHTARRLFDWTVRPKKWAAPTRRGGPHPHAVYRRAIAIFRNDAAADPRFERGKRVNLALAAPAFHGVVVTRERPLSFWRTLGRIRAEDGYQVGMEINGGCIVPSLGGGICMLSNALFEAAARLGWVVLERYGHSQQAVPDHGDPWGLDATVLWPHVDLRIAPRTGSARLGVTVSGDELIVEVHSDRASRVRVELTSIDERNEPGPFRNNQILRRRFVGNTLVGAEVIAQNRRRILDSAMQRRSCFTCDETACGSRERFLARAS